jgi:uncharacterized membrane protein
MGFAIGIIVAGHKHKKVKDCKIWHFQFHMTAFILARLLLKIYG